VATAEGYNVQVARNVDNVIALDTTVAASKTTLTALLSPSTLYRLRIRTVSGAPGPWSAEVSFSTGSVTATEEEASELSVLEVYPSPARAGFAVRYRGGGVPVSFDLYNSLGEAVMRIDAAGGVGQQLIHIERLHLPAGMYFLRERGPEGRLVVPIVLL